MGVKDTATIKMKGKRRIDWNDVRFAILFYDENVLVRYNTMPSF